MSCTHLQFHEYNGFYGFWLKELWVIYGFIEECVLKIWVIYVDL